MYLMPSATLISSFVTLSSGTSTRKPEVGFGVVGMKTATTFSFVFCCTSACCSLVRNPTDYIPSRGNSTSTTVLKEFLLPENASLICLIAP